MIEVTAGLLILSTLLVGILVAFNRHARQIQRVQRTQEAIAVADELLGKWFANPAAFPMQSQGEAPKDEGLEWRTAIVNAAVGQLPGLQIVRLEIHDRMDPGRQQPLAAVEVAIRETAQTSENLR